MIGPKPKGYRKGWRAGFGPVEGEVGSFWGINGGEVSPAIISGPIPRPAPAATPSPRPTEGEGSRDHSKSPAGKD